MDAEPDETRELLDRLGDKWTVAAIRALESGPKRFGELRRALSGVSQKVLTELVRALERDGFFSRHVINRAPLRVEYRLTPLGVSLAALLSGIGDWARERMHEVYAERERYDARRGSEGGRVEADGPEHESAPASSGVDDGSPGATTAGAPDPR
jgi:DNA-binding HxlR family transcriptional regulator